MATISTFLPARVQLGLKRLFIEGAVKTASLRERRPKLHVYI